MGNASEALRRAVFDTLRHAKFAAAIHTTVCEINTLMPESALKPEFKIISKMAYAASVHAWMAMIAMMGNSLDVALNAAQAAAEAKQGLISISRTTFLLDMSDPDTEDGQESRLPDESELVTMWNTFRASLPNTFPVPDSSENLLMNKD